jgi:polysaccharide biosynthesis transport protein
MNDNPLPNEGSPENLYGQNQTPLQSSSIGCCESTHSCRCLWIGVLVLGLAVVVALIIFAGKSLFSGISSKYTARGYLRVAYQPESLVFSSGRQPDLTEFDIFKKTQAEYLKNRFVLLAALRKPEDSPIGRLPILKSQTDPVDWLTEHLSVSYPSNGEIMEIAVSADDPSDAAKMATAIIDAYMSEVVDSEREKRRRRLNELDQVFTNKDREIRNKRIELKQLANELGTAETETLNLKQKLTLEELALYRNELMRSEFEVGRLKGELAARQAELQAVKNTEISDLEGEMFAQSDPVLHNLLQKIMDLNEDMESAAQETPADEKEAKAADKNKVKLEKLEKNYRERLDQIRQEIFRRRVGEIETEIKRLEAAIDIARKQQRTNEEEVLNKRTQAAQFGNSSVDVEMLRNDIINREKSLAAISAERDKLKVELGAPSRVSAMQRKVDPPIKRSP